LTFRAVDLRPRGKSRTTLASPRVVARTGFKQVSATPGTCRAARAGLAPALGAARRDTVGRGQATQMTRARRLAAEEALTGTACR